MVKNCVKTKVLLKELITKWINSQINYRHDTYFDFKVDDNQKENFAFPFNFIAQNVFANNSWTCVASNIFLIIIFILFFTILTPLEFSHLQQLSPHCF